MLSGVVDARSPVDDAGNVADRTARGPDPGGAQERRLARSWRLVVASFVSLAGLAVANLLIADSRLTGDVALLVLIVGLAGLLYRRADADLEQERRLEAESSLRILQGLARSVSPDAIVTAIVEDLGVATGADHTVVVRLRADARTLDATLVSSRAGVPSSTTSLPLTDLDDPGTGLEAGDADHRVAEQLATRVRTVYGLRNTLATALRADERVVGAIVLSRRMAEPWPNASVRLLHSAADEASAALARAYSLRQAETAASTDQLTGLPNRRYFDEFCGLLARRRRAEDAVGILMVDIDHFKRLNDRFGHAAGDRVLRLVAGAIASAVREGDVPARFGGEEFAVLLRNPGAGVALEVGERVRTAVAALDLSAVGPMSVSVSVGVAVGQRPDQPIGEIVEEADRALYRAKRQGRDRVIAA